MKLQNFLIALVETLTVGFNDEFDSWSAFNSICQKKRKFPTEKKHVKQITADLGKLVHRFSDSHWKRGESLI